jgi:hypothetical protein
MKNISKLNYDEVRSHFNDREILELTAQQLVKDLSLIGEEIDFDALQTNAYINLYNKLKQLIVQFIETDIQSLMNMLYRIDIGEKAAKSALLKESGDKVDLLAQHILKRELQKVLLKKEFEKMNFE